MSVGMTLAVARADQHGPSGVDRHQTGMASASTARLPARRPDCRRTARRSADGQGEALLKPFATAMVVMGIVVCEVLPLSSAWPANGSGMNPRPDK
jgi:hypothetical protein